MTSSFISKAVNKSVIRLRRELRSTDMGDPDTRNTDANNTDTKWTTNDIPAIMHRDRSFLSGLKRLLKRRRRLWSLQASPLSFLFSSLIRALECRRRGHGAPDVFNAFSLALTACENVLFVMPAFGRSTTTGVGGKL